MPDVLRWWFVTIHSSVSLTSLKLNATGNLAWWVCRHRERERRLTAYLAWQNAADSAIEEGEYPSIFMLRRDAQIGSHSVGVWGGTGFRVYINMTIRFISKHHPTLPLLSRSRLLQIRWDRYRPTSVCVTFRIALPLSALHRVSVRHYKLHLSVTPHSLAATKGLKHSANAVSVTTESQSRRAAPNDDLISWQFEMFFLIISY